nr:site-specific integrase [Pseudohalocynthiibacter aestuariivivens]
MSHAVTQGYLDVNRWAVYKFKKAKTKHSAKSTRRPFTTEELDRILNAVRSSNQPQFGSETIDRWAPWIASHHGLRIQEVCQLRICDFQEREGIWCMQITDEGEGQRTKNKASVRWVPVHPKLIVEGLRQQVAERKAAKNPESFVFQYWMRYKKRLGELQFDGRGRVSGAYGKRFASQMDRLELQDPSIVFHSFRHRLQDAADTVGIPDSHRRYLTGRANKDATEDGYGEGASMKSLLKSLARIDPTTG